MRSASHPHLPGTVRVTLLLLSWVVCGWPAHGAEPPRQIFLDSQLSYLAALEDPAPLPMAPVYVRQDTWHASMRASLKATFQATVAQDRGGAPRGFRPALIRLTADAPPLRLEFNIEGVERLYFATLGRYPEHGSAHFLRPRLFDKQGHAVELELGGTTIAETVEVGEAVATEIQVDDQTLRGFALSLGEVSFPLDGKYERLEVDVCYQSQMELPPCAAVDCRPIFVRANECRQVQEALWDLVARDFRDRQSQIEMEMERRDGIWNDYAPTGDAASGAYYLAQARERLALARKTLEFVSGPHSGQSWLRRWRPSKRASRRVPMTWLPPPQERSLPRSSTCGAASSFPTRRSISTACW